MVRALKARKRSGRSDKREKKLGRKFEKRRFLPLAAAVLRL